MRLLINYGGAIFGFETHVDFDWAPSELDFSLLDFTSEVAGLSGSNRYARRESDEVYGIYW